MLAQNMEMDDTKASINTKIMNNFLNFSLNERAPKSKTHDTQHPNNQYHPASNTPQPGYPNDPKPHALKTQQHQPGGLFHSQALGTLSKNLPPKKPNPPNNHPLNPTNSHNDHPKTPQPNPDTYESKHLPKGLPTNIQGINVLSSKVKKKPPTKPPNPTLFNAPKGNELNSYSSKQSSENKIGGVKRPSSAPVKGILKKKFLIKKR